MHNYSVDMTMLSNWIAPESVRNRELFRTANDESRRYHPRRRHRRRRRRRRRRQ